LEERGIDDYEVQTKMGWTALDVLADRLPPDTLNATLALLGFLFEHHRAGEVITTTTRTTTQEKKGETVLHRLVRGLDDDSVDPTLTVIKLLCRHGADLNTRNEEDGQTVLHLLSMKSTKNRRNMQVALIALLEHGADPRIQDNYGILPVEHFKEPSERFDPTAVFLLIEYTVVSAVS